MTSQIPIEENPVTPEETQRRGQLVLQALPVLLIPVLSAFVTVLLVRLTLRTTLTPVAETSRPHPGVIGIIVVAVFLTALIVLVRLGRPTVSALLLIGVWTLITTLAILRGGVTSIGPAFLVIPICAAGLLIDGVASLSLAAMATVLVASMAWLEVRGLHVVSGSQLLLVDSSFSPMALPLVTAGVWVGLYWTVALLTWLLAGGLQRALRNSREHEQALQELSANLEARVAAQTAEILNQAREAATLEERTRLARDIHDTLAQGLTGIVVQLGAAERALAVAPDEARDHLALARRMARESLAEARRSVWNLRAPALDRGKLADALRSVAVRPLGSAVAVTFELAGEPWPLTTAIESTLLRIAQEALANVARHSQATEARLALIYTADSVQLSVSDNGIGFDPQEEAGDGITPGLWGGFGLIGMRERIAALGGTLTLRSHDGAQVLATIPRPGSAAPEQEETA